ncbi:hypothetical protein M5K25_006927 [Dendrobium thyrsiflorum]|uniref:Uncharacterized protein n=1 Tax=Dendrobium thyrsiflorum TaxID=117978 RepID=A0ABD0VK23_DENTH
MVQSLHLLQSNKVGQQRRKRRSDSSNLYPPAKPRSRTATRELKEPSWTTTTEPHKRLEQSLRLLRSKEVEGQRRNQISDLCDLPPSMKQRSRTSTGSEEVGQHEGAEEVTLY